MGSPGLFFKVFFGLLLLSAFARADDGKTSEHVSIAAASNLIYVLEDLNAAFHAVAPQAVISVTTGASGNLVAQIAHGAPYDVFLSADLEHPEALIQRGDGAAASLITFARGELVLWTVKPGVELPSIADAVTSPAIRKLAVANLLAAPYGRAAKQALEKLHVWQAAEPKLIVGENITQTAQFVETGNADAGFVALSLVLSPKLKTRGRWIPVPPELHPPLDQGAVLTTRGAKNPAAARYLEFLRSDAAREVLKRFGYGVPQ